jgi:hypothetical protein
MVKTIAGALAGILIGAVVALVGFADELPATVL